MLKQSKQTLTKNIVLKLLRLYFRCSELRIESSCGSQICFIDQDDSTWVCHCYGNLSFISSCKFSFHCCCRRPQETTVGYGQPTGHLFGCVRSLQWSVHHRHQCRPFMVRYLDGNPKVCVNTHT